MPKKATGRKRSAPFATRLAPDLKKQLEASAKANSKGNMSREVERLLRQALASQKESDERMRALAYLVGQVATFIGPDWSTNPWGYRAFKVGVSTLLERFNPDGELVRPASVDERERKTRSIEETDDFAETLRSTPEKWGEFAGYFVWRTLLAAHAPDGVVPDRGSVLLAMPQARQAMGIPFEPDDLFTKIVRQVHTRKGEKE